MRNLILGEMRRLALQNGGKPPGRGAFARETGITEGKWSGVIWARWSEALAEAGFAPNVLQERFDSRHVLLKIIEMCRELGRLPTRAEMKLYRRRDRTAPSANTIHSHFPGKARLVAALKNLAATEGHDDILAMLDEYIPTLEPQHQSATEGMVYLLKSGEYSKIGRSEDLERRVREVRVGLPEKVVLIHAIRTDDPSGIEAYWHRRFGQQRANGEWFRLTAADIRAFCRRKFQ